MCCKIGQFHLLLELCTGSFSLFVRFCIGVYFNEIYSYSFYIGLEGKTGFSLTTSAIEMLTLNARKMSCGVNKMTIKVVLETLGSGWIILYNLYKSWRYMWFINSGFVKFRDVLLWDLTKLSSILVFGFWISYYFFIKNRNKTRFHLRLFQQWKDYGGLIALKALGECFQFEIWAHFLQK